MKKSAWIVVILFALSFSLVLSVQTIDVRIQQKGVYTQDRVVYTVIAYETNGINATNYVFPVVLGTNLPCFDFFKNHSIYVATDPDCEHPIKYWVQHVGQTDVVIWVHVPTMQSSSSITIYICASTTNPAPESGNPEINHMFALFDDFDGNGYVNWSQGRPGIVPYTTTVETTVKNGTLTMIFKGGSLTEAGLVATTVNIASTPYFIMLARMSASGATGVGIIGGLYMNMSNYWASMYVANAYIEYTDTRYHGFFLFFSSAWLWISTSTYPQYLHTTLTSWMIAAQWHIFGNTPVVYQVVHADNMNIISYTSVTLLMTGANATIGLFQLRWNDGIAATITNTVYVDWFALVQYQGFPSLSYVGASLHNVLLG